MNATPPPEGPISVRYAVTLLKDTGTCVLVIVAMLVLVVVFCLLGTGRGGRRHAGDGCKYDGRQFYRIIDLKVIAMLFCLTGDSLQ